MLIVQNRKHGINFYTVWFAKEPLLKKGVVSYREYMGEKPDTDCVIFDTLVTDLSQDVDIIRQSFSKSCKNNINKAAREDISFELLSGEEVTDERIEEFLDFFEEFWKSKGIHFAEKDKLRKEMCTYRDMGALSITYAYVNGEKAVYHTYIVDEEIVRSWHSASLFRIQDGEDKNLKNVIGIANRALHYEEILYFKKQGKLSYDWGGAGTAEDVVCITEFKKSFGGIPVEYYNFEQVNGLLAKLFKLAVRVLGD